MEAALLEPAPQGPVERQHRVEAAPVAGASTHSRSGRVGDQLEPEVLALAGLHGVEVPLAGPAEDAVDGAGNVNLLGAGRLVRGRVVFGYGWEVVNQETQRPRNALRRDHPHPVTASPGRRVDPQSQGQFLSLGRFFRPVALGFGSQLFDALHGGGDALPVEPDGIGPLEGLAPQGNFQPRPSLSAQRCNGEGLRFRCLASHREQRGQQGQDPNSLGQEDHVSGTDKAQFPDSLCLKRIRRSKRQGWRVAGHFRLDSSTVSK